jgi:acyl-CoA thioesterase YciA
MNMSEIDEEPTPIGNLALQTLAMPADTNPNGDVFGGWLMSQMDLAGSILAQELAQGRITTVAVGSMHFLRPVPVGATVSCYADAIDVGRSSITVRVCVWMKPPKSNAERVKVTEGEFVFVAIDDNGRTRAVPS